MLVKDQLHNYASQRPVPRCEGQRGGVDARCCVRAGALRSVLNELFLPEWGNRTLLTEYTQWLLMIELHIK